MLIFLIVLFSLIPSYAQEALTFEEWKREQIQQAENYAVKAQNQWVLSQRRGDSPRLSKRYKGDLAFSSQAIDIAMDFSIEDYVSQYLKQLPNPNQQLRRVSAKMSKEDVHRLLVALMRTEEVSLTSSKPNDAQRQDPASIQQITR